MSTRLALHVAGTLAGWLLAGCAASSALAAEAAPPNIVFLLTDDQRADALGCLGNGLVRTPHLDSLAARGTRFDNAFVTLSICSPSRAACLTGRYGSANGVTTVGGARLNADERTFAHYLKTAGYQTGVVGKWHLHNTPQACGFDFATTCFGNGTWYGRRFEHSGEAVSTEGFVDRFIAEESLRFVRQCHAAGRPFVLWMCLQLPHMDKQYKWPVDPQLLARYDAQRMPLPESWNDDLSGKPAYLATARNRTQALEYGYARPQAIRQHAREYYAAVEQMDGAVGMLLEGLDALELTGSTWLLMMGDNGWMLGEHGFTSKVLAYEESIRVPMIVAGPGTLPRVEQRLVLNIDLTATVLDLAGVPLPGNLHGRSLLPLVRGDEAAGWRHDFLYEAPSRQLGSMPLWAVRDDRWKYIETRDALSGAVFPELYDLQADAGEMHNRADDAQHATTLDRMAARLAELRGELKQREAAQR